jgi:RNA polymerase sigma factor (sigma-70 family)
LDDSEAGLFEETIVDDALLPSEALALAQEGERLHLLISELPIRYQQVLTLYYQESMTLAEVAAVLQMPLNTVKSYHRRALEALRKRIVVGAPERP